MKLKKLLIIFSIILCLAFTLSAAACFATNEPDNTIAVASIALDRTSTELAEGETLQLNANVLPSNATGKDVSWQSSNAAVATVNSGTVTAISAGTATITATAGGKSATCAVTVIAKQPQVIAVTGITLNKSTLNLEVEATQSLVATVLPSNATEKSVSWRSSNAAVVTVNNGTITAISAGTATITATAGGKNATCIVTVTAKQITPAPDPVAVESVTLNKTTLSLEVEATQSLVATVLPSNATGKDVSWQSSNAAVATVNSGTVTAISAGTATITATAGGKSATCAVTVTAKQPQVIAVTGITLNKSTLNLEVEATQSLVATVLPSNATGKSVSWQSSNAAVATVNNGTVTAVSVGTATITATAGGKNATCAVTVTAKQSQVIAVTGITLDKSTLNLEVGENQTLVATVLPSNATEKTVNWQSADTAIATVSDGTITAVSVGTVKITATAGSVSAECEVTVSTPHQPIPADSLLTYAHAGEESAAFEWKDANAGNAKVVYKLSGESTYKSVDKQLIRKKDATTARVDIVGLKGGAKYDFKITSSDGKSVTINSVNIAAIDRSGYAHFNFAGGIGGYNDDGTPKTGAVIIYVTEENKNNVDGSGKSIAEYLAVAKNLKTPLIVRFIGTVGSATWNEIKYSEPITPEKIIGKNGQQLPTDSASLTQAALIAGGYNTLNEYPPKLNGKQCVPIRGLVSKALWDSEKQEYDSAWNDCQIQNAKNITIEGIGEDAEIFQWGMTFKSCNSIEVRNLRFYDYTEDACSFEGSENSQTLAGFKSKNFWIHNNTFDIGVNYWDICKEQDKHDGDGATDFKKLAYVTVSYNHYIKTHKTGLVGGNDTTYQAMFTFHHNYYEECDQRMPLSRQANIHIYNNYFYKSGLYSVSVRANAYVFIENCAFTSGKTTTQPVQILKPEKVTTGVGLPSCKIINSTYEGKIANGFTDRNNLYDGTDRLARVEGDNLYGLNFDTDSTLFYFDAANQCSDVTNMLAASQVPTIIPQVAGVLKRKLNIDVGVSGGGGGETELPVDPTPDPDPTPTPTPTPTPDPAGTQSLSYTQAGASISKDTKIATGELFDATLGGGGASPTQCKVTAAANDDSGKTFDYMLFPAGGSRTISITAKQAISLTIYYSIGDGAFATSDNAVKDGFLQWTKDGGMQEESANKDAKSNLVAYSETIIIAENQTVVFSASVNRLVLFGLFASVYTN